MARERRGGTRGASKGTRRARKGKRANSASGSAAPQAKESMPPDSDIDGADQPDKEESEHLRKKIRRRNMKPQEKLVLMGECCEHAEEYRAGNETQFWALISNLLRERTRYEPLNPQQTVTRWARTEFDELVDEEMGSATKAERDAFKTAVEQFTDRWELVLMENDNPVETRRQNVAENLEGARLQNSLTFQLDDDGPIPILDASRSAASIRTNWSGTPTSSIALASRLNNKRKRYSNQSASSCAEPSADALLLANACRDGMAVLANALLASQNPEPASAAASTSYSLQSLEQRMDRMDKIEARLESCKTC